MYSINISTSHSIEHLLGNSAHGLSHVIKYRGSWSLPRCTWFVIFTATMISEFTHLTLLLQYYLQYPSSDSFCVSEQRPQLPANTVCNMQPV